MKNLLIALVILSSLVSCGKKNTVGSNTGSVTSPITVTNNPTATSLGAMVTNNQFGLGQATYYETWNQYVSHAPNTVYKYGALNNSSSGTNPCHTVAYIFTVCTSSSVTTTSSSTVTRSVVHSSVDLTAKQNELIAIINKTNQMQSAGYGVYYILTTDGINYVIDTKYPIQANPVQRQGTGVVSDTLVQIQ